MKPLTFLLAAWLAGLSGFSGQADSIAATPINALGIDLLRQMAPHQANALLSPYSIQMAMAMACAGADGQTRAEMIRVLHYSNDENVVNRSFADLQADLNAMMERQAASVESMKQFGITNQLLTLTTANRLFGQQGYDFRPAYLSLLQNTYQAPFETMDFIKDAAGATTHINTWVEEQTRDRIRDLIPAGALDSYTRLVLVNAIYLKAPWNEPFSETATQPMPFHLAAVPAVNVPTMYVKCSLGYAEHNGFRVVVIPYDGSELQFVILLPEAVNGLSQLEARLTPQMLASFANLPGHDIVLYLPKFKLEPPVMSLSSALKSLGMTTAFDIPKDSANFDRMAPRRPDNYLYISDIFHKTFLKLDESGTEAAAATVVIVPTLSAPKAPTKPIEVRVDHPFLFAIQHRASGACLFLGQVTDPR